MTRHIHPPLPIPSTQLLFPKRVGKLEEIRALRSAAAELSNPSYAHTGRGKPILFLNLLSCITRRTFAKSSKLERQAGVAEVELETLLAQESSTLRQAPFVVSLLLRYGFIVGALAACGNRDLPLPDGVSWSLVVPEGNNSGSNDVQSVPLLTFCVCICLALRGLDKSGLRR